VAAKKVVESNKKLVGAGKASAAKGAPKRALPTKGPAKKSMPKSGKGKGIKGMDPRVEKLLGGKSRKGDRKRPGIVKGLVKALKASPEGHRLLMGPPQWGEAGAILSTTLRMSNPTGASLSLGQVEWEAPVGVIIDVRLVQQPGNEYEVSVQPQGNGSGPWSCYVEVVASNGDGDEWEMHGYC
jgi:hypothetical protein